MRDIRHDYTHNFQGLTAERVPLVALLETRESPVQQIQRELDDEERRFLLSLVRAEPHWLSPGIPHLEHLPGIRWKLHNLEQLRKANSRKFNAQADARVGRVERVT